MSGAQTATPSLQGLLDAFESIEVRGCDLFEFTDGKISPQGLLGAAS